MKISEYIVELQKLQAAHGDLEVQIFSGGGHRNIARTPKLDWEKKLVGKERTPRFWYSFEGEETKGAPVVRLG